MPAVLFVCTGNICRSPMAAAFAEAVLNERGAEVQIASAGFMSPGRSPTQEAISIMKRRGFDVSGHLSNGLEAALSRHPDLVVTMTREQAREISQSQSEVLAPTFPLKDLVRSLEKLGPRNESLDRYFSRLQNLPSPPSLVHDGDVADPFGLGSIAYEECATELEVLVKRMIDHLWPEARLTGSPGTNQ